MKQAEYTEIEKIIEEMEDIRQKAVFRFIIKLMRKMNPGEPE